MVTLGAPGVGGLSPNGRILVLSDNVNSDGTLRDRSRFAVVDTRTLAIVRTIALRGDYSFDALSPGRTLAVPDPSRREHRRPLPGEGLRPPRRAACFPA